jgi:hypothetical protein
MVVSQPHFITLRLRDVDRQDWGSHMHCSTYRLSKETPSTLNQDQAHSHTLVPYTTTTASPPSTVEMSNHIIDQLTDSRAIIRFLDLLDDQPPDILRMIAGHIVAKLCPGAINVNEVNNFSSSVLRRLSFSRKLASAALHELPRVVTIEYNAPRLYLDLLQYTSPLARRITWLPFPSRQLQHLALLVPLGGSHAHYLFPGMTDSISSLPRVFPGLKPLSLVMNWDGEFIIPGTSAADVARHRATIESGVAAQITGDFFGIVRALCGVRLAQKSVHDRSWSNGPVCFDGSRKAALVRLLQEDLMSRATRMSLMLTAYLHRVVLPLILASDDEDESWWYVLPST